MATWVSYQRRLSKKERAFSQTAAGLSIIRGDNSHPPQSAAGPVSGKARDQLGGNLLTPPPVSVACCKNSIMRFGINSFLFTSPFTDASTKLFAKFKKWGFQTVEIPIEDPSHIDAALV